MVQNLYYQAVQRDFDQVSETYDQVAQLQQDQYLVLYQLARPFLPFDINHDYLGLDIGSGPGQGLSRLQQHLQASHIKMKWLALDLSAKMLIQQQQLQELQCLAANMNALPLRASSIDLICSNFALHWSSNPQIAIQEIYRVLRKTGIGILCVPVRGSLKSLDVIWQEQGLASPLHLMPAASTLMFDCKQYGRVLSSELLDLPLKFKTANDCFKWLKQTGVKPKRPASSGSRKNMTRRQYQGIVNGLSNVLMQGTQLKFTVLNLVIAPFPVA